MLGVCCLQVIATNRFDASCSAFPQGFCNLSLNKMQHSRIGLYTKAASKSSVDAEEATKEAKDLVTRGCATNYEAIICKSLKLKGNARLDLLTEGAGEFAKWAYSPPKDFVHPALLGSVQDVATSASACSRSASAKATKTTNVQAKKPVKLEDEDEVEDDYYDDEVSME